MLLPLVHLLDESFSFLVVGERQTRGAVLQLECVKEYAILAVLEIIVDLLVPNDTSAGGL